MRDLSNIEALVGKEIAVSDWMVVDQVMVDAFASVTGDRQFIHVDPEMARENGMPGTIAHGFLVLSLLPALGALQDKDGKLNFGHRVALNYGCDKVRFITPVSLPSRIRLRSKLHSMKRSADSAVDVVFAQTVEIEGHERPAMYAEVIDRLLF